MSRAFVDRIRSLLAKALAIAATASLAGCATRHVALTNTAVDWHGVLLTDAFSTELGGKYSSHAFLGTMVDVGPQQGDGEVAVFGGLHGVTLKPVDWGTAPEIVQVPVSSRVPLGLSIWILQGPFAAVRLKALGDVAQTEATYAAERLGMFFNVVDVLDVTGNTAAPKYANFDCSQQASLRADIGQHSQRINVYYVNQVQVNGTYATTSGNACSIGGDFVAIGSASGSDLLSHEIGHTLGLTHTDELPASQKASFDSTSVMWSGSNVRAYLTEGETFRAHMSSASFPNISPGKPRLGEPIRNCTATTTSKTCPAITKRLWNDGVFPKN